MGSSIPASFLFLPLAALCVSIALMNGFMAAWRKEAGFVAYALAFLFASVSSAGNMEVGFTRLEAQALNRLLLLGFYILMTWGIRLMQRRRRAWPPRFYAYAILPGLGMAAGGWFLGSSLLIELSSSIISVALCLEYILAIASGEVSMSSKARVALMLLPSMFIVGNLSRLLPLLVRGNMDPGASSFAAFATNIALAVIFYMGWEGAILVLDGFRLQHELSVKNAELETLATTDKLTGLRNRLSLDGIFHAELVRAERYGGTPSLIMFDIDHFKDINDTWGHAAGDRVLVHLARIVRNEIREPDFAFRWGGEEFIIIAPNTDLEGASALAEKVRLAVEGAPEETVGKFTISCGVASGAVSESMETWFKRADEALYRAKREGRNRVRVWDAGIDLMSPSIQLLWREDWASGNDIVDAGHRELIELGNSLLESSLRGDRGHEVGPLLERFMARSARHFKEEEAVMDEFGYPDLAHHRSLHEGLLAKAETLSRQFAGGGLGSTDFFDYLVKDFLSDHIIAADRLFFPWTRRGRGDSSAGRRETHREG